MDDVVDQIERFAGYLRLYDGEERIKALLEGAAPEHGIDLRKLPTQSLPPSPDPLPPTGTAGGAPSLAAPEGDLPQILAALPVPGAPSQPWADFFAYDPGALPPVGPFAPPVILPEFTITVTYGAIGSQVIHIRQVNMLEDGDTVLANAAAGRPVWADADTDARLAALAEDAGHSDIPDGLVALRDGMTDPDTFAEALRDVLEAQEAGAEGWIGALTVDGEGVWLNGVLTEEAPERPDFFDRDGDGEGAAGPDTVPDADVLLTGPDGTEIGVGTGPGTEGRNGLERPGMEAELGGNVALSTATILDLNDVGGTLVVMGDVHDLSVIWQTNMLSDLDEAHLAGPVDPLAEGINALTNLARFQTDPSMIAPELGSALPIALSWHVDVVEGDLVDFNMLLQHNVIRDGDLTVQHAETGFQRFVLGENEAVAAADLMVLRDYYDAIFVGGDMIRANMIFQYNAVIDDDAMRVIGSGAEGTAAATGGGNTLWNEALIQRVGEDIITPVSDGAREFLDVLEGRDGTIDDAPDLPVPGGGGAPLRVLYVEGDYWDVNAIGQTNEIHDADAALQLGVGEVSLATGGNTAANVAQIVDFRGQGEVAMVGGEHYDDEMMIQTNILAEDQDVRVVDAQTLAGEVIAFLDPDLVTDADEEGQFGFVPTYAEDDMLSGVMA